MKRFRKMLSLFLILTLTCGLMAICVQATEQKVPENFYADDLDSKTHSFSTATYWTEEPEDGAYSLPVQVNPLYRDQFGPENLPGLQKTAEEDQFLPQGETYLSLYEAADVIRQGMKERQETISVSFTTDISGYQDAGDALMAAAMAHTGDPLEGDSLLWQYYYWSADMDRNSNNGEFAFDCIFYISYYTTAEQEAELTAAVNQVLAGLSLQGKSDYEKIYEVYDYICRNITYDYANLEDESYLLKYTAYAALIHKTAVCQGYALLFYRMMLELGIDCRVIAGDAGEAHGWNIVQLDGLYYNVDSTWDSETSPYAWFLKSFWDFGGHERYMEYDTIAFHQEYPIAAQSYEPGVPGVVDPYIYAGYCGGDSDVDYTNAIWCLGRDGSVYITGEGELHNYTTESNRRPYYEYWKDEITGVVVDEGITTVGEFMFYNYPWVREVEIGSGVENIGSHAFYQCAELESLTLQEGLDTISRFAFCGCSNLTQVDLPSTLRIIWDSAFQYDHNLVINGLPENLEILGGNVFNGCAAITSVTIPGTLNSLGSHIFTGCQELETVTFAEGCTTVGQDMFTFCNKLNTVNLPSTLTTIEANAFHGCAALESISLPQGLSEIRRGAFQGSGLRRIEIPDSITVIEDEVFQGCGTLTDVVLPETITSLGANSFYGCAVETFDIPAGVTHIGQAAVAGTRITSVVLPEGLKRIESYAFADSPYLTEVTLPEGLEYFSGFARCPALTELVLPEGLQQIGDNALQGCTGLTSLQIPQSVTTIGSSALAGCSSLDTLVLPQGLTAISDTMLFGCTGLTELTIPATVTGIGGSAFSGCSNLSSITFQGNAPGIDGIAFFGVTATAYYPGGNATWTEDVRRDYGGTITWVPQGEEIPPADNKCGDNATWHFADGTLTISGTGEMYNYYGNDVVAPWNAHREEITHLVIEDGITFIGEAAFASLPGLQTVSMPDSVTYIGNFAFMLCEALQAIDLPEHLTGIGQQAFWRCSSVESVIIPASVTFLDVGAFEDCSALTDVLFLSDPDLPGFSTGNSLFRNCTSLEEIRVEEGHLGLESIDGVLYFIWRDTGEMCLNDYPAGKKDARFRVADNTVIINQMSFWCNPYLEELTIPATVNSIGNYSFSSCSALNRIQFEGSMPEVGNSIFWGVNATVSYPCGDSSWDHRESWNVPEQLGDGGSITWEVSHEYQDGSCIRCGEEESDHVPGDITGDGVVNNKDLTRLFRYLSGYPVEVVEEALDITGDGSVNNKDVTRLFRYLSGYPVEIH